MSFPQSPAILASSSTGRGAPPRAALRSDKPKVVRPFHLGGCFRTPSQKIEVNTQSTPARELTTPSRTNLCTDTGSVVQAGPCCSPSCCCCCCCCARARRRCAVGERSSCGRLRSLGWSNGRGSSGLALDVVHLPSSHRSAVHLPTLQRAHWPKAPELSERVASLSFDFECVYF